MVLKRWITLLLSLLMLVSGPAWAACPMTGRDAPMQMEPAMAGAAHGQMTSAHHEMPCKDMTLQCPDGTNCISLSALAQPYTGFTPPHLVADRLLPRAMNGPSLSIKPDIPPPIAGL
jgi:hypothetical protein